MNLLSTLITSVLLAQSISNRQESKPPTGCNIDYELPISHDAYLHGYTVCGDWLAASRWARTGDCRAVCPDYPWKEDVG